MEKVLDQDIHKKELLRIVDYLQEVTHILKKIILLLTPEQKMEVYNEMQKLEQKKH